MFREHHRLIWRTLRRLGLSPDAASDTTQQAYLIAGERLVSIRQGCERAYLFSTAIRLAKTNYRRNRRCQLDENMDLRQGGGQSFENTYQQSMARQALTEILGRFPIELETVFVLYELEGQSLPEVSKILNIPVGTATSRLRRARELFRNAAQRWERRGAVDAAPSDNAKVLAAE